jgi:hypothetical protein
MDQLATFPGDVRVVFGNNDADLFRITRKSTDRVQVHGELFEADLGGKLLAMNHFDFIARPMSESGRYDVVCYGHNHQFKVERVGKTMLINPGAIMGAAFSRGVWEDVPATFVLLDTDSGEAQAFEVEPGHGRNRGTRPFQFQMDVHG